MTDEENVPGSAEEQAATEESVEGAAEVDSSQDAPVTDATETASGDAETSTDEAAAASAGMIEDEIDELVAALAGGTGLDFEDSPDVIRLQHRSLGEIDGTLHYYEGEVQYVAGIAEFPADRPEWAQRAWRRGFRLDPVSGQEIDDIDAYLDGTWVAPVVAEPVPFVSDHVSTVMTVGPETDVMGNVIGEAVAKAIDEAVSEGAESAAKDSAESAGDDVEGLDVGRLTPDGDRLRPSPEDGSGGVPGEGLGSGDGDGAAVPGEADGAAA